MGQVYRARDARLDRTVAIKILPSADPELKARFDREARTIASLQDPHICALLDLGSRRGHGLSGARVPRRKTLAERIRRGPLPLNEALTIGIATTSALDRAHRAGVVHRDLKPENIMLTHGGPFQAAGFRSAKLRRTAPAVSGLSTAATAAGGRLITAEGTIVGTLHYMSPEQIDGGEPDPRSDIGVWLRPLRDADRRTGVSGNTPASLIAAIMHGDRPTASARKPSTPASVDRVRDLLRDQPGGAISLRARSGPSAAVAVDRRRRHVHSDLQRRGQHCCRGRSLRWRRCSRWLR